MKSLVDRESVIDWTKKWIESGSFGIGIDIRYQDELTQKQAA